MPSACEQWQWPLPGTSIYVNLGRLTSQPVELWNCTGHYEIPGRGHLPPEQRYQPVITVTAETAIEALDDAFGGR